MQIFFFLTNHDFSNLGLYTRAWAQRPKPSTVHYIMEDDFALRYARTYPGVNNRTELVTLAPGLCPERCFAPLARG